jgi:hypothetical protein
LTLDVLGAFYRLGLQRTLLDKMLGLLDILAIKVPFYFVADAYYAAGSPILNSFIERSGAGKAVTISSDPPGVADWRNRMGGDDANTIYKERAATAECATPKRVIAG